MPSSSQLSRDSRRLGWIRSNRPLLLGCLGAILAGWLGDTQAQAQISFRPNLQFDKNAPKTAADLARAEADAAYQRGDYNKVVEVTNRLLQIDPTDHVAYHFRASAQIELGRNAGSTKLIRDGIADSRQALALAGNRHVWLYLPYLYGMTSLSQVEGKPQHVETCIQVVTPVLDRPLLQPSDKAQLLYQRGYAYRTKGDSQPALADFNEALRLAPDHLGSHLQRAELHAASGDTKTALASYDRAAETFPNVAVVFNDRGALRRSSGNLDGAIADFTRAVQIDPKFSMGYLNRAICATDRNEHQGADSDFTRSLQVDPNQFLAYRLRGNSRLAMGRLEPALADFSAALKLSADYADGYEDRGFARIYAGQFTESAADFAKARELNPQLTRLAPWQAIATWRTNPAATNKKPLAAELDGPKALQGWNAHVAKFLLGDEDSQALLAATGEQGQNTKAERECEARYFMGQKALLEDNATAAAEHFRESVKTGASHLAAYRGARYELKDFKN
jgi:tetratricopeptide (TPR) repeat protein